MGRFRSKARASMPTIWDTERDLRSSWSSARAERWSSSGPRDIRARTALPISRRRRPRSCGPEERLFLGRRQESARERAGERRQLEGRLEERESEAERSGSLRLDGDALAGAHVLGRAARDGAAAVGADLDHQARHDGRLALRLEGTGVLAAQIVRHLESIVPR